MNTNPNPPEISPPAPPKKMSGWLIALLVAVVLCLCCFGVIGLLVAFGEDILNSLGLYMLLPLILAPK